MRGSLINIFLVIPVIYLITNIQVDLENIIQSIRWKNVVEEFTSKFGGAIICNRQQKISHLDCEEPDYIGGYITTTEETVEEYAKKFIAPISDQYKTRLLFRNEEMFNNDEYRNDKNFAYLSLSLSDSKIEVIAKIFKEATIYNYILSIVIFCVIIKFNKEEEDNN